MNTTTIKHKYNIGDKHFDFDDRIGEGKIKEFEITKINIKNVNGSKFITYSVNRRPDTNFANETELNEEEICPTIEDWIEKKTSDYKKELIKRNSEILDN